MRNLVLIGVIVGTKGLDGTLKLLPQEVYFDVENNSKIYIGFSPNFVYQYTLEKYKVTSGRYHYFKVSEINSLENAKKLVEQGVFIQFYGDFDSYGMFLSNSLLNFEVLNISDGRNLGKVIGFQTNPGNDLLLIQTNRGTSYVPFVKEYIKKIDKNKKFVFIKTIPGLLE
ncbi:MAG: ribosome maturation factor RimM [Ignavibacteria bacterium]|nr:ribosome maturation factor RimM [Ignavibacteria bacterium]